MPIQKIFADRGYVNTQINVSIDTTLTQSGKIADAKVVGNKINQIFEEITALGTQEDIVQQVIAALGTPVFGRVESDNTIVLTGSLVDGMYTYVFEGDDGERILIGTVEHGEEDEPAYTNILGVYEIFLNKRWSASGMAWTDCDGMLGIKVPIADVKDKTIRFKGFPKDIKASGNIARWYTVTEALQVPGNGTFVNKDTGSYTDDLWYSKVVDEGDNIFSIAMNSTNYYKYNNANIMYVMMNMPVKSDGAITEADIANLIMVIDELIIDTDTGYTNLADPTSADWLTNQRINSSGNVVDVTEAQRGDKTVVTINLIDIKGVSVLHIKGLDIINNLVNGSSTQNYGRFHVYNSNKEMIINTTQPNQYLDYIKVSDYDPNVWVIDIPGLLSNWGYDDERYCRLAGILTGTAEDVIITADEPIIDNGSNTSYTNVLPLAINSDGTSYVGDNGEKGYKAGYRLNSTAAEAAATGMYVTGFMPIKHNDWLYLENITCSPVAGANSTYAYVYFWLYDSNFTKISNGSVNGSGSGLDPSKYPDDILVDSDNNVTALHISTAVMPYASIEQTAYIRFSAQYIDEKSIVTVNQEID